MHAAGDTTAHFSGGNGLDSHAGVGGGRFRGGRAGNTDIRLGNGGAIQGPPAAATAENHTTIWRELDAQASRNGGNRSYRRRGTGAGRDDWGGRPTALYGLLAGGRHPDYTGGVVGGVCTVDGETGRRGGYRGGNGGGRAYRDNLHPVSCAAGGGCGENSGGGRWRYRRWAGNGRRVHAWSGRNTDGDPVSGRAGMRHT